MSFSVPKKYLASRARHLGDFYRLEWPGMTCCLAQDRTVLGYFRLRSSLRLAQVTTPQQSSSASEEEG